MIDLLLECFDKNNIPSELCYSYIIPYIPNNMVTSEECLLCRHRINIYKFVHETILLDDPMIKSYIFQNYQGKRFFSYLSPNEALHIQYSTKKRKVVDWLYISF